MTTTISIVGGGLAGLVAAVACAEENAGAGLDVVLYEAHSTLGGRARATEGPRVVHEGPHVFYSDGPHWRWLVDRDLTGPVVAPPLRELARTRFRQGGGLRRMPAGLLGMLAHQGVEAPVDRDFTSWADERFGERASRAAAAAVGAVTYDHDPGRLSAAFVWDLFRRITAARPPAVRYVVGGWPRLVARLADRARELGVRIEVDARVDTLPPAPVIVATQLESARSLLGVADLSWESGRCVLVDVAMSRRRGDPFVVFDLDEAGFVERFSGPDPSLAPPEESLIQADMPWRPGEARDTALERLDRLLALCFPDLDQRTTWRRTGTAGGRSGALDLPGWTWRDRPAVDRGDGVFLAGDLVAAPGMRAEVSINSALLAAEGALGIALPAGRRPDLTRGR